MAIQVTTKKDGLIVVCPEAGGTYTRDRTPDRNYTSLDWSASVLAQDAKFRVPHVGAFIASSSDTSRSSTGGANTLVLPARGAYQCNVAYGFDWSYSDTPTGCTIQLENGSGSVVWGPVDITSKGPGFFHWSEGKKGSANTEMILRASAPASGVYSTITWKEWRIEGQG